MECFINFTSYHSKSQFCFVILITFSLSLSPSFYITSYTLTVDSCMWNLYFNSFNSNQYYTTLPRARQTTSVRTTTSVLTLYGSPVWLYLRDEVGRRVAKVMENDLRIFVPRWFDRDVAAELQTWRSGPRRARRTRPSARQPADITLAWTSPRR
jgi:hypothetical protein